MKKLLTIVVAGLSMMNVLAQSTLTATVTTSTNWGVAGVTTTLSTTSIDAIGTNLINGGCIVSGLTFVNNSSASVPIALFDAPQSPFRAIYTNGVWGTTNTPIDGTIVYVHVGNRITSTGGVTYALATWTQGVANVTRIVTNYTGITTTNTFTNALVSGWNTNLNSTNNFRRAFFISVPANSTVTPNLGVGLLFGHGVTMTNGSFNSPASVNTNITVIVNYDPSL